MNDTIARYEKLLTQFPENELARFSLGKAWFDGGEFARAKEQFDLALLRKPDWMVVQILIGKCELARGNRTAARAAFARALELAKAQHHDGPREELEELLRELEADSA